MTANYAKIDRVGRLEAGSNYAKIDRVGRLEAGSEIFSILLLVSKSYLRRITTFSIHMLMRILYK